MQEREHERHLLPCYVKAPDDVARFVPEEVMFQHLQLDVGMRHVKPVSEVAVYRRGNAGYVPSQVLVGNAERIIFEQLGKRLREALADRVVIDDPSHIDRRYIALRRKHKGVLVTNRPMTKVGIENGVVESLGNLEIGHALDQIGIQTAGFCPEGQVFNLIPRNEAGHIEGLHDCLFVNIDTPAGDVLHARPLRPLKAGARGQSNIFKLRKIGVEAVQDDPGEALLFVHWRPLENAQGSVGGRMLRRNLRIPPIQRS